MAQSQSKRWVVTTSGDQPIKSVAKQLTQRGFAVDQVFDEIGSITGSADDGLVEKLRKVPGVADVSPELSFDIGPPDASVS